MKDTLIIFKLTIKSSYNQNKEIPADEKFDTLQFYVHGKSIWRIKTFALDQDIQIYPIPLRDKSVDETIKFLITSTNDHYGDVVNQKFEVLLDSPDDEKTAEAFFKKNKLNPKLEFTHDFAFWNPDNETYHNQSRPL